MEFRCRLGTPGGEIIEGVYVAESEARLRREFEEKGLYVLAIQRAGRCALSARSRCPPATRSRGASSSSSTRSWRRCSRPACRSCSRSTSCASASATRCSSRCSTTCTSGCGGAARCRRRSRRTARCFPGVYTASLLAGEKSGNLEQVIRRYVAYVKVVSGVRRKTISALVYPAILLVLSIVVVSLIVLKVVPEFGAFYDQFGEQLPLSTRVIVAISALATTYFIWIVAALAALGVAAWMWLKQPGQRKRFDRWILKVPMLGPIAQKFSTSQAARTLATLLGGGIPLVNAIEVSAQVDSQPAHGATS